MIATAVAGSRSSRRIGPLRGGRAGPAGLSGPASFCRGERRLAIAAFRRRGRPLAFDPAAYRGRNAAERRVGWLKGCRGVGIRLDKLAVNLLAMVKLACVGLLR